jgi:hypothetical protein
MTGDDNQFPNLYEIGRQSLERFRREFASYGIECDPGLEIRRGAGMLCYYDFNDRQIYLSMPDLKAPTGKLQMMMLRQMIGAESSEEMMRFLAIFIPFVVAHEMAHHLRHRCGLFEEDSWREEQLANKMAAAVNKHRIPPEEKAFAIDFLERSMKTLGGQIGIGEDAVDSYYDIAHALHTTDRISSEEMINLRMAQGFAASGSVSATMILRRSGSVSGDLKERLEKRRGLISNFNQQYAGDAARYIYYQVGWVYLAMKSRESSYVNEFARKYLGMTPPILDITLPENFQPRAIYACFRAFQEAGKSAAAVGRYFYKRYRTLLLDYLKNHKEILREAGDPEDLNFDFLSDWDDRVNDPLNFMISMIPPFMREIFPRRIARSATLSNINLPEDLPTPEDRQMWLFLTDKAPGAVQNTVRLLERFDALEVFRTFPPETILDLAQRCYEVRYSAGESLVWQGEGNNDVFILLDGRLEAVSPDGRTGSPIEAGEVFGEIAWLTKSTRAATVRATAASTCLVIKDNDLRLLCHSTPGILMAIAARTAQRFKEYRSHREASS